MTAPDTHTADDLADRYGKSREYVQQQCRAGKWPHLKVGRSYRFTDQHVAQIDAMHEVKARESVAAASWGRKERKAS